MILFALALAAATVPRFDRAPSAIALSGPARASAYLEASGRRAAFLGRENGSFESWVYPLKILHDFELAFAVEDYASPIPGASLAVSVDVRPEASTIRYAHSAFTADAIWFVPLEEPGGLVLLDIDASEPVSIHLRFRPDLRLMWPAGLGGQYSYWDRELSAYVLTESTRKHAALVGSPLASDPPEQPAHNLPDAPTELVIPVSVEAAASGLVPVVIAASDQGLESARETYERMLSSAASLYRSTAAHYRRLYEERTRIDSPDDELDLALEWGKVALDKGFVCNPKLGCGLIAGLGPSGRSERPGFGWFFGGDAFINGWSLEAIGDHQTLRDALRFLSERQRADGKMMHELSQAAAYIPWFEEFPYGYYHADTTPLYIVSASDYVEASSDLDFARSMWPSIRKAYEYCSSTDEDGDGLMDNTRAGLGAVETGALRSTDVLTDVYLAAAWTEATKGAARMARALGELDFAREAEVAHEKARSALNRRFLDEDPPGIAFALLRNGSRQHEVTAWPSVGLWRGLFDSDRPAVTAALDALASSELGADWGARMLARTSGLYDHESYNNGAVWPFLSGFAALALYEQGRPRAAWAFVEATKALTFLEGRGYVPELLSGDRLKALDAAVPHQLFSTSGLVTPLLRGLVGHRPGRLAPKFPAGWTRLRVLNLRDGGLIDLEWERRNQSNDAVEILRFVPQEGGAIRALDVELSFPPGAKPPRASFRTKAGTAPQTLEVRYRRGIELSLLHEPLALGRTSTRLRILAEEWADGAYKARLEGRSGRSYRMKMETPLRISEIEGARELTREGETRILEVSFPASENEWTKLDLLVR